MIKAVKWPIEYFGDEFGQFRPVCRCSNDKCSMAMKGLAWTYLDVKFPQIMCKGCGNEFEFLRGDCTNPNVSFSPPYTEQSSKGGAKGKNDNYKGKGSNYYKGNGKGEVKGDNYKGKGKGAYKDSCNIDIMTLLQHVGAADIISPEQVILIKEKMQAAEAHQKPMKSDVQIAKEEYKSAIAGMNTSKHLLTQAKENLIAIDMKFKAALITMCEHTRQYTQHKEEVELCKANLDQIMQQQDAALDEKIIDIANAHSNAAAQLGLYEEPDSAENEAEEIYSQDGASKDDCETVYDKATSSLPPDIDMTQAAIKRSLPPLNLSTSQPTEELMHTFLQLNVAKKAKSTPRAGEDGPE